MFIKPAHKVVDKGVDSLYFRYCWCLCDQPSQPATSSAAANA